jgi:hypothetical protein
VAADVNPQLEQQNRHELHGWTRINEDLEPQTISFLQEATITKQTECSIVVDRLGRDTVDVSQTVTLFESLGARIVFLDINVDTRTANRRGIPTKRRGERLNIGNVKGECRVKPALSGRPATFSRCSPARPSKPFFPLNIKRLPEPRLVHHFM